MIRGTHHGGNFRHRHAEFLLAHDRHHIIGFEGKCDTQFLQHKIVVNTTLWRQRRRVFCLSALIVNQAIQKRRENDVRAANKPLFVFFGYPTGNICRRGFHFGECENTHQIVVIRFQDVAHATKNVVT
ncbi:hypothetical protein D3C80_1721580 [compost metagenome]